jgi:hypothetical protein
MTSILHYFCKMPLIFNKEITPFPDLGNKAPFPDMGKGVGGMGKKLTATHTDTNPA